MLRYPHRLRLSHGWARALLGLLRQRGVSLSRPHGQTTTGRTPICNWPSGFRSAHAGIKRFVNLYSSTTASPHAGDVRRMLETAVRFSFSPSAFQASLQTSIFQARDRTTGADMSITEKRDVKNHLSLRHSKDIFLCAPLSQPDATGYSLAEPAATRANPSAFTRDYSAEHTIAVMPSSPAAKSTGSTESKTQDTSKSARP